MFGVRRVFRPSWLFVVGENAPVPGPAPATVPPFDHLVPERNQLLNGPGPFAHCGSDFQLDVLLSPRHNGRFMDLPRSPLFYLNNAAVYSRYHCQPRKNAYDRDKMGT